MNRVDVEYNADLTGETKRVLKTLEALHHGKDLDIAFFLASILLTFIGSPLHKRDNLKTSMLFWARSEGILNWSLARTTRALDLSYLERCAQLSFIDCQKCRNKIEKYYSVAVIQLPAKAGEFLPYPLFFQLSPAFAFLTSSLGLSKGNVGMIN